MKQYDAELAAKRADKEVSELCADLLYMKDKLASATLELVSAQNDAKINGNISANNNVNGGKIISKRDTMHTVGRVVSASYKKDIIEKQFNLINANLNLIRIHAQMFDKIATNAIITQYDLSKVEDALIARTIKNNAVKNFILNNSNNNNNNGNIICNAEFNEIINKSNDRISQMYSDMLISELRSLVYQ
jgi:hypothetical protein